MADETIPQNNQTTIGSNLLNELPSSAALISQRSGGVTGSTGGRIGALASAAAEPSEDVGDTINKQFGEAVPAFGSVLASVADGVARSQRELDKNVIAAIKKLNDKKIKVVTVVEQELNDDGRIDASKTKLITNEVSVLTYARPSSHRWSNVRISMDLAVGKFHAEQGLEFNTQQRSQSIGGAFTWGFGGWFDVRHSRSGVSADTRAEQEVAWSSGQCRIDALLEGVRTNELPVSTQITNGPQIYITQGPVTEQRADDVVTSRTGVLFIDVRRHDGRPNNGVPIELDAGPLLPSFEDTSTTNAEGRVTVTLRRDLGSATGFRSFPVTAALGSIRRTLNITL